MRQVTREQVRADFPASIPAVLLGTPDIGVAALNLAHHLRHQQLPQLQPATKQKSIYLFIYLFVYSQKVFIHLRVIYNAVKSHDGSPCTQKQPETAALKAAIKKSDHMGSQQAGCMGKQHKDCRPTQSIIHPRMHAQPVQASDTKIAHSRNQSSIHACMQLSTYQYSHPPICLSIHPSIPSPPTYPPVHPPLHLCIHASTCSCNTIHATPQPCTSVCKTGRCVREQTKNRDWSCSSAWASMTVVSSFQR